VDGGFDGWDPQTMNDTYSLFDAFGDKIAISIVPEGFPHDSSEDEQREAARAFAKRFCVPGKTAMLGHYAMASLTPAFAEEVYIQSRKRYFDYTC
jgi:hypothetical protein